jgi:hypothetical protein
MSTLFLVGRERAWQIALTQLHVPEPFEGYPQVALRLRIAWSQRRELAEDVNALSNGRRCIL